MQTYRDCIITEEYPPGPIGKIFSWQHRDYDGPEDRRSGWSFNLETVKEDIDTTLDELED